MHLYMKWKVFLLLLVSFCSVQVIYAQKQNKKITITGTVTDENMKPIEGASIFVDGEETNSVTNSKGFYRVKVSPTAKGIGVLTPRNGGKMIDIDGSRVIDFQLDKVEGVTIIPVKQEEDLVDIGYGKVKRRNLTTEVNRIKGQQSRYQSYPNIYEMIRGEVPGVDVVDKSIRIRNAFSYQLSTEPLFVVDGMIVPRIDDISPLDVKSIEVLKGASASVYGARGANGVLLITTLRGGEVR